MGRDAALSPETRSNTVVPSGTQAHATAANGRTVPSANGRMNRPQTVWSGCERTGRMAYIRRAADGELSARLRRSGAVLVEGAKWRGKTETASRIAGSVVHVDTDVDVPALMDVDPKSGSRGFHPAAAQRVAVAATALGCRAARRGCPPTAGPVHPDRFGAAGRCGTEPLRGRTLLDPAHASLSLWGAGWSSGVVRAAVGFGPPARHSRGRHPGRCHRGSCPRRLARHGRIPLEDARRSVLDRRDLLTQADLSRTVGVQHYRDGFTEHAGGRRGRDRWCLRPRDGGLARMTSNG